MTYARRYGSAIVFTVVESVFLISKSLSQMHSPGEADNHPLTAARPRCNKNTDFHKHSTDKHNIVKIRALIGENLC